MKRGSCFLLLPLILVLIAIPIEPYFIDVSRIIKLIALLIIFVNTIVLKQRNIFVYFSLLLITYLVFLIFYNTININQGVEDGIRYLFPLAALIYSFQLKKLNKIVFKILLGYILLNDFFQLINDIIYMFSAKEIDFVRASGFVGFFDLFGFINLIGLVILNELEGFKTSKYNLYFKIVFSVFALWSLSLKIFVLFLIYVAFKNRKLLLATLLLCLILLFTKNTSVENAILLRIDRYLINKESARNESYRVVLDNFNDFFIKGTGPGTFGGPASTKYNSPLYEKYNFNWYGESLATTDTYYPHLFVELGILFGFLYLLVLFGAPILISQNKTFVVVIVLILALNSVFSFALNSINYCFFSLILVFIAKKKSTLKVTE